MTVINGDAINWAEFEREFPEHSNVLPGYAYADIVEDYYHGEHVQRGIQLPWSKAHGMFRIRPGEVTIWAGTNGHGKSLLLNQIILQAMKEGETACIASMEMKPHITLARMTRQACGAAPPTRNFIHAFHDWLDGKLWMYDQQGTVKPERMLSVLRYCHLGLKNKGKPVKINHFVVDSLMKCGINTDDYNRQKSFVDQLCAHARDSGTHIHLVAHSRKSESEKKMVDKFDIKGASEITDQVDNVMTVWRNKGKEDEQLKQNPEQHILNQPDAMLICSKQRHGEAEPRIALWFHRESTQFVASEGLRPIEFFDYHPEAYEGAA